MRVIPAIDLMNGACVRLTQGDYASRKVYDTSPLSVARDLEQSGCKYLHLVDLDGAKAGHVINWSAIEDLTKGTSLAIDFGGGVRAEEDLKRLFELGVQQVNLGSMAVQNPELVTTWLNRFGAGAIILSADVRDGMVAVTGWQQQSALPLEAFIDSFQQRGALYVTCTDISRDGMLAGPGTELYRSLIKTFPKLKFIASGGVSSLDDLRELEAAGLEGAIVGKALYEGRIDLDSLSKF